MADFQLAMCHIVPSMYQGVVGMVELNPIHWEDIGGLQDVKQALKQVGKDTSQGCAFWLGLLMSCSLFSFRILKIKCSHLLFHDIRHVQMYYGRHDEILVKISSPTVTDSTVLYLTAHVVKTKEIVIVLMVRKSDLN